MKRRRRWRIALLVVSGLVALAFVPLILEALAGWWRGEAFWQGRPTSHWRGELVAYQKWQQGAAPTFLEWAGEKLHVPLASGGRLFPLADAGGDPAAVPVLRELVRDPDADVQGAALETLARLGRRAREAEADVRPLVQAGPLAQRIRAAGTLWALTGEAAAVLPTLTEGFRDPRTAMQAAEALRPLGPAAAPLLPAAVAYLADPKQVQFYAGLRLIGGLGPAAAPAVPGLVAQLQQAEAAGGKAMDSYRLGMRFQLLAALGQLGPVAREAAPAVRDLIGHREVLVSHAVAVLVVIDPGNPANLAAVVALFQDPDPQQRRSAIAALIGMGPEARPAVPDLVGLVGDPDVAVATQAALALRHLAPEQLPAAVARLTADLQRPDRRTAAVRVLAALGPDARTALPALQALDRTAGEELQAALALAYRNLEPPRRVTPWHAPIQFVAVLGLAVFLIWAATRLRRLVKDGPDQPPARPVALAPHRFPELETRYLAALQTDPQGETAEGRRVRLLAEDYLQRHDGAGAADLLQRALAIQEAALGAGHAALEQTTALLRTALNRPT